ncbi:unnamed protein product [Rotaria magnacalcarata]|uniref:Uncharacterized protein n=1 Tax=Rotaria magnacalcarata TaxID=392030 RepID=A0A8S2NE71_9BILA|nr:unnamed protein product [Rotaria magnacalcarata]
MCPNDLKSMNLIYQGKEIALEIGVNIALERLMNMIKLSLNIPRDIDILLFGVMRNIFVVPSLTSHLWCNSETKLPIYHIITQKNNGNDDNKINWLVQISHEQLCVSIS